MADEPQTPVAQPDATQPVSTDTQPAQSGAQDERKFSQADLDRIVKERLDRANAKAEAAAQQARDEATRKAAEEQGKFKELYEAEVKARETAVAEMKALQLQSMRREVAAEVGLPNGLAARLIGETREQIEADAKKLLETLPKASNAPNLDGNAGSRRGPSSPDKPSEAQIIEMAARYNVSPQYLAQQYGVQLT